ncbi:LysR substrate-binding domain-containing protein [Pantoea ananatis]
MPLEGIVTRLSPQGRFVTNDSQTLIRWLKAGNGIAYVRMMWVADEIKKGEIDILFPQYQSTHDRFMRFILERDKLPLKVQVVHRLSDAYFEQVAEQYKQHRKS